MFLSRSHAALAPGLHQGSPSPPHSEEGEGGTGHGSEEECSFDRAVSGNLSGPDAAALRACAAAAQELTLQAICSAAWVHLQGAFSGSDWVSLYVNSQPGQLSHPVVPAWRPATVVEWLREIDNTISSAPSEGTASLPAESECFDSRDLLSISPALGMRTDLRFAIEIAPAAEIGVTVRFDSTRFAPELPSIYLGCFLHILRQIPGNLDRPVAELQLVPDDVRDRYLGGRQPGKSTPLPWLPYQEIEQQAANQNTNAIAGICGENRLTFGELNASANQFARWLRRAGVSAGAVVGIHLPRSLDLLIAIVAVWKAGGAALPLDISLPKERVSSVLRDGHALAVVTESSLAGIFWKSPVRVISIDAERRQWRREAETNLDVDVHPDGLAYVIFTSGSTGPPKGVLIEHRNLAASFDSMDDAFGPERGVWLSATNISFDIAFTELTWTLSRGFTVVLHTGENGSPVVSGPRSLAADLFEHGVTHYQGTPASIRLLLADPRGRDALRLLRHLCLGGEPVTPALASEITGILGGRLFNMYGPTECTVWSTCHLVDQIGAAIPIGRRASRARTWIVDRHLRLLPPTAPGELLIGGHIVARGYLNQPELTREKFIPDPFAQESGARLYRSGDLVSQRLDGAIDFIGRIDSQVKLRGYRIELGEIEAVLESHCGVRQAIVLVREGTSGAQSLAAFYRPSAHYRPSAAELRTLLSHRLPSYMVPSTFLELEAVPLTANGKVDRAQLLNLPVEPARASESDVSRERAAQAAPVSMPSI